MENRKDFDRFAALYWGQNVAMIHPLVSEVSLFTVGILPIDKIHHLQLRSIESLTDEEFSRVSVLLGNAPNYDGYLVESGKNIIIALSEVSLYEYAFSATEILIIYDYLRSIGILVPFDKYSIEQILSLGWAVVK